MAAIGAVFFALIALFALATAGVRGRRAGQRTAPEPGRRGPYARPRGHHHRDGRRIHRFDDLGRHGKWVIPVPAQGSYDVSIDVSTLPEGIGLTDPDKIVITTTVQPPNLNRIVIFPLGESTAVTNSKWAGRRGLAFEGVRFGLLIALGGTGPVPHLRHHRAHELRPWRDHHVRRARHLHAQCGPGDALLLAAILGVILTALFGAFQNRGLWKPLRKRGTGLIAMMIVSIGLAITCCATCSCSSTAATSRPTPSSWAPPDSTSGRCP